MPRPLVPDSTVFVRAIQTGNRSFLFRILRGEVWLSSVVVCELLSGTRSQAERDDLRLLVRDAAVADRLLVPSLEDWQLAGTLIARRARLMGAVRPWDHLGDVLILICAARIRGEVATANLRHFNAWADLARRAGLDVTVAAA